MLDSSPPKDNDENLQNQNQDLKLEDSFTSSLTKENFPKSVSYDKTSTQ